MTTEQMRGVLADAARGPPPLVAEAPAAAIPVDDSCLHGDFPVAAQQALVAE